MAKGNPYHVPAGSSKGGQFTSGQLDVIEDSARKLMGISKRERTKESDSGPKVVGGLPSNKNKSKPDPMVTREVARHNRENRAKKYREQIKKNKKNGLPPLPGEMSDYPDVIKGESVMIDSPKGLRDKGIHWGSFVTDNFNAGGMAVGFTSKFIVIQTSRGGYLILPRSEFLVEFDPEMSFSQ